MAEVTPRVNSRMMGLRVGKRVRLVGKIVQTTGQLLVLETSDHGQVQVQRARNPEMISSAYVEVIGQVQPDMSLQEFTVTNFGDQFDLDTYDRMLQAWERHGSARH